MSYRHPSAYLLACCNLLVLLLLSGCAGMQARPTVSVEQPLYRSELADGDAKALYAFGQYRLLAEENRWPEAIAALERAVAFDPAADYLQLNLARALLHLDQADRSIEILQELLLRQPGQVDAHELIGDLLSYRQQYAEAVVHYRMALELSPENEMLQMRLAMALGRQQRNAEAIQVLQRLVDQHPEARLARMSLARFYRETGQTDLAMATWRELLQDYPTQQQAILEYGKLLEEQRMQAEAYQLYRQGIVDNPRAVAVREQLALLYLQQKRLLEGLEQLQAILQLLPEHTQILVRVGLIHLELEDWSPAEGAFRQLVLLEPEADEHRYYLGLALLGQGRSNEAQQAMAPIKQSSPVFAEAVLQLAYLYKESGQDAEAIAALQQVLEQDISKPEIYYYLASFLGDGDQLAEAEKVVLAGLQKFPDSVDLRYQLGVIYEQNGNREQALEEMQQVLVLDGGHPDALNFIAYHQAENDQELELALSRALQAASGKQSGYIIDTLGWIYYKLGRYAESREQLEKASELHPEDPVILEHLGDLYRALTLWDEAAVVYQRVLAVDPQAAGVDEKLQMMLGKNKN